MIITKCKKCIFAAISDGIQTGCSFDIPQSVISDYPTIYDNKLIHITKGYYELHNFYCPYARTTEWKETIEHQNGVVEDVLYHETKIKYNLITLLNQNNLNNFYKNISTFFTQPFIPSYISLISRNINETQIKGIIDHISKFDNLCEWKLHNIIDNDMTPSETIDFALDNNLLTNKYNLLMIMNNDYIMQQDFLYTVNKTINSFIQKKAVILPKNILSFNNIVIPTNLYETMDNKIGLVLDHLDNTNDTYKFCIE